MMVGRDLAHLFPPKRPLRLDRPIVLRTNNLTIAGAWPKPRSSCAQTPPKIKFAFDRAKPIALERSAM
jgi:hypothetical protein